MTTTRRDLFLAIAADIRDHQLPTVDVVTYDDPGGASAGLAVNNLADLERWARHLGAGVETIAAPDGRVQHSAHGALLDCPVGVVYVGCQATGGAE